MLKSVRSLVSLTVDHLKSTAKQFIKDRSKCTKSRGKGRIAWNVKNSMGKYRFSTPSQSRMPPLQSYKRQIITATSILAIIATKQQVALCNGKKIEYCTQLAFHMLPRFFKLNLPWNIS